MFDVYLSLCVQFCECANVRVTQTFPLFRSHLIILCAVSVRYAEDPQILLATLHNVFTRATGHLKFVHLYSNLQFKKMWFCRSKVLQALHKSFVCYCYRRVRKVANVPVSFILPVHLSARTINSTPT